jgi:cytochrome c
MKRVAIRAAFSVCFFALAGCEPADQPATGAQNPASRAPAAGAARFDAGEIKTPAEYLEEPRFAGADLARGELLSLACAACHTLRAGERHNIGPNLHGVFGRKAATAAGFSFSAALKNTDLVWTPRALEAWLADPARFVPDTTMAFTGYRDAADRRDLLAYLLTVTD